jgi:CDP-glycerol glycerophosphotransferase (TagB/SpsB family)
MRLGFLFNHYAAHQVLHAAPIAFELSRRYPQAEIKVITVNSETEAVARRLADRYPGQRCVFVRAEVPRLVEWLDPVVRQVKFLRKGAALDANLDLFAGLDVLVVPEKTSLKLKTYRQCRHLKFVHTRHGAGDRAEGFHAELGQFDLVLVPGPAVRDRVLREGLVDPARCRMVGYPKFELMGALADKPPAFAARKPTVLYNPHFSGRVSSWRAMGRDVLEFFRASPDYNLIFAPHVILYRRAVRHGARPLGRYRHRDNILIDTGSTASFDMTYTMAADIYLGDVSSQVYEFLWRPRPCIFLDAHRIDGWERDPNYRFWHAGRVLRSVAELPDALAQAADRQSSFAEVQRDLFASTFDIQSVPASTRAADAIADFFEMRTDAVHAER